MMKPGELKRALVFLSVLCVFLFIYLYWQQTTTPTYLTYSGGSGSNAAFYTSYTKIIPSKRKSREPPRWTWQCINQRCERRHVKVDSPSESPSVTSLSTCSMLCGSTQLWPQPTGPVTLGSRASIFRHDQIEYETDAKEPARSLVRQAFAIFNQTIIDLVKKPTSDINEPSDLKKFIVRVTIADWRIDRLKLDTNESYHLTVKPHHGNSRVIIAHVIADNFFGARHGLETLSQLVWWDDYASSSAPSGDVGGALKLLKGASIQDGPAFPYRGLMVDTARNFMSVQSLKRVLVGMAANKLNAFHWHIADSQSFPLISKRVPLLAQTGAYSPEMTYSPEDVERLVEFGRVRGIRVIIEVDTPAHAGNGWTWGPQENLGDLAVCVNERPWSLYCGEPPCGQLNPLNPNVYEILQKLYQDLLEMTKETEIFHLGGDEVNLECWAQHLQKSNGLSSGGSNYTDLHDLWGDFTLKSLKRLQVANGGKQMPKVIVWSSNLSKRPYVSRYFNKSVVVVQSWGASNWPDTPDLLDDGYKVIISHVDAWYLDCGFGRWRETGDAACDPYRPWQTVYNHRPWQQLRLNKRQILGGEACLWSEQLDEGSLDTRLWPRGAAFAERVWSDPQLDLTTFAIQEDVYTRLNTQRDRLIARGLGAEAMWPQWCTQNPGMCL